MPMYDPEPITYVSSGEEETQFDYPVENSRHIRLEPTGSAHSNYSINAKPTHATLAETFSDPHHSYDFVDARDDQGSRKAGGDPYANTNGLEYADSEDTDGYQREGSTLEFVDSEEEGYAPNAVLRNEADGQYYKNTNGLEYADSESQNGYEYADGNETAFGTDNDTMGYTVNDDGYYEENTAYQDEHEYSNEYHDELEDSTGAMHNRHDGVFSTHLEETSLGYETCETKTLNTNLEGMNYVHDEPLAQDNPFESQGYYYGDGEQYYEPDEYQDPSPSHHHSQARQSVGTAISKRATSRAINDEYSTGSNAESGPMESYDSDDSGSSWDDGSACSASRDVSLLDSADSQDLGEETFDDDASSFDDSRDGRRRRRPATMLQLLNQMKNCALKGATASYEEGDFEFLPDVALVSTNVSSKSSMTEDSGKRNRRRRQPRGNDDTDSLFGRMSALGEEFIGKNGDIGHRRQGNSRRNRQSRNQTTRIIASIRDIFSCGGPSNY